jgi:phosphoribosylanthranilate isomerase
MGANVSSAARVATIRRRGRAQVGQCGAFVRKRRMPTQIKICGLSDEEGVDAALDAGADYLGFVFFPKSPRNVILARAVALASRARGKAALVALTVDADDRLLSDIAGRLRPDLLQLHGAETAERIAAIRTGTGIPVMKAAGVASRQDVTGLTAYKADALLLDAKPPGQATRPGGNGVAFDWSVLAGFAPARPWFLSGGLHPGNVAAAVRVTGAPAVDVSSGVETSPGRKDPALIHAFVAAVRNAEQSRRLAG